MATEHPPRNPFQILGVPLDADGRAVRRAFAEKLREARSSGDSDATRSVQDAFAAIRDDRPREEARRFWENESRIRPFLLEAEAALETGDVEKALRALHEVLAILPNFVPVLLKLAAIAAATGDVDAAFDIHGKLTVALPHDPEAAFEFSRVCVAKAECADSADEKTRSGFLEKALRSAGQARERGKDETSCRILEASILRRLGRKEEARASLEGLAAATGEIDGAQLSFLGFLLLCDAEDGNEEAFRQNLEQLRTRMPVEPRKRLQICAALEELSRKLLRHSSPLAVRCAELALECLSGAAGGEQGQAEFVRDRLRRIIDVDAGVAPIVQQVGKAMQAGNFDRARELLRAILVKDPESLSALQALADVEHELENAEGEIEQLEKIVRLVPWDPGVSFRLAAALASRGSPESPEPAYRKRAFLEKGLAAVEKARGLGADEGSCTELASCMRVWLGQEREDREILETFVKRLTKLDAASLRVVVRLLHAQAHGGFHGGFRHTLEKVRGLLPEDPGERKEIAEALLEAGGSLLEYGRQLAIQCGELAAVCRPDDPKTAGAIERWRRAPRKPIQVGTPDPEPRRFGFLRYMVAACILSGVVRACSQGGSPHGGGSRGTYSSSTPPGSWLPQHPTGTFDPRGPQAPRPGMQDPRGRPDPRFRNPGGLPGVDSRPGGMGPRPGFPDPTPGGIRRDRSGFQPGPSDPGGPRGATPGSFPFPRPGG